MACCRSNTPRSRSSGRGPTSSWTGRSGSSRRCGSGSFTPTRHRRAPSSARFPRRASPARATTGTLSGTPRRSSFRCSAPRRRMRRPTRCAGGTRHSISPGSGLPRWNCAARHSRGGRSAARSARRTGRPAPPAMHLNADIAVAAARHVWWTGDDAFERECALPLLVETARLWISLGYQGADGRFHIDGVTGPDEYSALSDDNAYTNLMAAKNLRAAAAAVERWPEDSDADADEVAAWTRAAEQIAVPYSARLRVHEQAPRVHRARRVGLRAIGTRRRLPAAAERPLLQPVQPAGHQAGRPDARHALVRLEFTAEDKARAFAYYEPLTVRDSSLPRARRRCSPPRWVTSTSPPTTSPRRR